MAIFTVEEIDSKLQMLSEEKLAAVYYFVSYLADNDLEMLPISSIETALISEVSLAKDWNTPEEDKAWAHLSSLPSY